MKRKDWLWWPITSRKRRDFMMDQYHNSSDHPERSTSKALAIIPHKDTALTSQAASSSRRRSRAALNMRLQELRCDVAALEARLREIKYQSGIVVQGSLQWIDASAHDQLGAYPWLKLSGASLAAFMVGRLLHHSPLGLVAIATKPLLFAALRSISGHREF